MKQPSIKEISQAAMTLGLSPEATEKAAVPMLHWEKTGSVTLKKAGTKTLTLKGIASEIVKARQRETQAAADPRRDKR